MRRAGLIAAVALSAIVCAAGIVGVFVVAGRAGRSADANCEVLAVLLNERANRDEASRLFAPIRAQNPAQFDKLIRRAQRGDRRLAAVSDKLSCEFRKTAIAARQRRHEREQLARLDPEGGGRSKPPNGGSQPTSPPANPGGGGGAPTGTTIQTPTIDTSPIVIPPITLGPLHVDLPDLHAP